MKTLLQINSSPMGDASISRQLSEEFVKNWLLRHPDGKLIVRDLAEQTPSMIDAEWVAASFTPEDARNAEQRARLAISDTFVVELEAADEYVVATPMHNFTIATALRVWIDLVARPGKTFTYVNGRPTGMLKDKKATFLVGSGGMYGPGSPAESFNFIEPYLRSFFGFMGVTATQSYAAGGASAVNHGKVDRETFLRPHLIAVQALFPAA